MTPTLCDTPDVAAKFAAFDEAQRPVLLALRHRILKVAQQDCRIGPLLETLRWGQPSYLTAQSKSGTTLRLGLGKTGQPAMFVHCQTLIISDFRALHEDDFSFDGTRALYVKNLRIAKDPRIAHLIQHALTYHLR